MTQPFEVGVVVDDPEAMERFYREALGCLPVHRSDIPPGISGPAGLGGALRVVWLQVPSGGRIKLIHPRAGTAASPTAVPTTGRRGLAYLTFHVRDLDLAVVLLAPAGARPVSDPVVVRARGRRISFWTDPEGNVIELVGAES